MHVNMRSLILGAAAAFLALCIVAVLAAPGQASAQADRAASWGAIPPLDETSVCLVQRDQATWGQYTLGLTITPDEQHDENGNEWVTTWRAAGLPGLIAQAQILALHCTGDVRGLTYCAPDRSAYTTTHTISFTVDGSGSTSFSVREQVSCCEFAQVDLIAVNGSPWGSSYFDRKAWSEMCPLQSRTATATVSASGTATGTPTPSVTATATAIDATPTETATGTPEAPATLTPTQTATETPTTTPTASETPTGTPSASETPTATATATATETATVTATPTETSTPGRRGLIWYFPIIHKDDLPVF